MYRTGHHRPEIQALVMKNPTVVLLPVFVALLTGCAQQTIVTKPAEPPVQPKQAILQPPAAARPAINVIGRERWAQAPPVLSDINPMGKVWRITIHHEARESYDPSWVASVLRLRGIQKAHFQNGWADIGYHYLIDCKGRIWEGRSLKYQGAHVRDNNEGNVGIALLGDFNEQYPTKEQKESLRRLVDYLRASYNVSKRRVYTHGELVTTECPGAHLQAFVNELRRETGLATGASGFAERHP